MDPKKSESDTFISMTSSGPDRPTFCRICHDFYAELYVGLSPEIFLKFGGGWRGCWLGAGPYCVLGGVNMSFCQRLCRGHYTIW